MLQNTQAFILKVNPKGETSAILHCFSKDFGKIILIAKGARTAKSPFRGLIEPFSLLNVHFNEKKDRPYQFLSQAEYQQSFSHLKSNPEAILYGSVILEILYKEKEVEANVLLFDLLLNVFNAMENGVSPQIAHWYFILRFLEIEGLSLNTENCYHCDQELEKGYFLPKIGSIRCQDCHEEFSLIWELDPAILSLLKDLPKLPAEQLGDVVDSGFDKEMINRILWNTLATRFDTCRTLKSVDVLRKVL
ncbi:MAG: DNA repair protein RecO [Candidatus Marinimicrobia bacterium]|nr:DNA repair protein RecO [Candidatus Neomarinimicrobiota bacterium]